MRILLAWLLLAAAAGAQEPDVRAAEQAWAKAIVAADTATLENLLGNGLIYAHSTGVIDSKRDYLAKISSGKQKYAGATHDSVTVKLYGAAAIVHSHMHMWGANAAGGFDDQLMTMHVWVKQGGRWQLVAHQTTKLK